MCHRQIVDTARCYELAVESHNRRPCGVEQRQIVVENILCADSEFFCHEARYKPLCVILVCNMAKHGKHILLFRQRIAFVDRAVEMDGKMWYG